MKFEEQCSDIANWVKGGWIAIGCSEGNSSFIRVPDGGMVWEGKAKYPAIEAALEDAESRIIAWLE